MASKYSIPLSSKSKIEQVAPISAPIFVIVAFPVVEILFAPSPKYSTIELVAPFTVNISATFKIISFGAAQPLSDPFKLTPIKFGNLVLNGQPDITSTASAPPTPIATIDKPPAFGV